MSTKGSAESYVELRGSLSKLDMITGKSAYEIAVMHGFEGTEEEWLASLPGTDGITPHIGANGNWWFGEEDSGVLADLSGSEDRIKALEDAVADLNYKAIAISGFSASPSSAEMGSTVASVALSWSVNKTPTALTLDGTALGVSDKSKTVTGTFKANKTWTLKATDERGTVSTKTATLSFLNGVYTGVAAEPTEYNSAFVLGLTKTLRSSFLSSFSANAGEGQYIYYCLPTRMGKRSFKVGGFDGGFSLIEGEKISFTNASGYTEDYYIYRSDNAGLGQTTVTVS